MYDYYDLDEDPRVFVIEKWECDEDIYEEFRLDWADSQSYQDTTDEEFEQLRVNAPDSDSKEFKEWLIKRYERRYHYDDYCCDSDSEFSSWESGYNNYLMRRGY